MQNSVSFEFSSKISLENWNEIESHVEIFKRFAETGFPPTSPDDTPLSKEFFDGTARNACKVINRLKDFLENIIQHEPKLGRMDMNLQKSFLVPTIVICAAFSEDNLWTSEESIKLSTDTLSLCCKLAKCTTISEILASEHLKLAVPIFKKLQLKLSRTEWRKNPSYCAAFFWIIKMIKAPVMSDILKEVLPVSLLLLDDFIVENQLKGIQCIECIVDNVPAAELKWHGRADVLYDALERRLYTNEERVILQLYPCMVKILKVVETDPKSTSSSGITVTKCDHIYDRLLSNLEREDVISLRRAYAKQMTIFIDHLGITTLKHMKKTVGVILRYLEVGDRAVENSSRRSCLLALTSLIRNTHPRILNHLLPLLKGLLRLSYDVSIEIENNSLYADAELRTGVKTCLRLLRDLSPEKFNDICLPLVKDEIQIPGLKVLREVFQS